MTSGAYVLGGEIRTCSTCTEALRRYEGLLRPYAERSQQELTPRLIRLMHVRTRFGIGVARVLQRLFGNALVQKLLTPSAED